MKKTIVVGDDIEVLVVSFGGVGTTFLMKHLEKFVRINDYSNLDGYKHLPIPALTKNKNLKVVYIFGDPVLACVSLFRREYHYTQSYQMNKYVSSIKVLSRDSSIEDYVRNGRDEFYMMNHFNNWKSDLNTIPTIFVRYETIHDHLDEIKAFLNLEDDFVLSFPQKKTRESNVSELPQDIVLGLENIYRNSLLKAENRNYFIVSNRNNWLRKLKKIFSYKYIRAYIQLLKIGR